MRDLVEDIALLSGGTFETFGNAVIEAMRPPTQGAWIHPGTNLASAPVKSTVDSTADSGALVAQYTSDGAFFSATMNKAKADIAQARANHKNMRELWLLSSRKAGPKQRTNTTKLEASEQVKGLQLKIVDSRQIANHIVDHLHDESIVGRLEQFLGTLRRIEQEHAFTHDVRVDRSYVPRPEEATYLAALQTTPVVKISGMSGVGKSALAANLANKLRHVFELVIWVDASGVTSERDLLAVDVQRRGVAVNLAGLMKRRFCLIILDDLRVELRLDDLLTATHPRTRLIVTSQYGGAGTSLSAVDEAIARAVLSSRGPSPCPDDVFSSIWKNVGGHPGALTLLAGLAQEESNGWDAARDASEDPSGIEDERHQRLAERILDRHRKQLATEIELLAVAGKPQVDIDLWKSVCGPNSLRAVTQRGLLAASSDTTLRVHELVFSSACKLHDGCCSIGLVSSISRCIEKLDDEEGAKLHRLASAHSGMFERLAKQADTTAAIRYAFALTWPRSSDSVLQAAIADARTLAHRTFESSMALQLRAALESIEALYNSTRNAALRKGRTPAEATSAAQATLETLLGTFDAFASIENLPVDIAQEIQHHRAKVSYWLRKIDEARKAFEKIVQDNPAHTAARLQLARIYADTGEREAARGQIDAILALPKHDVKKTLAAFETLKRPALRNSLLEVVTANETLFLRSLERSLVHGYDQAVGVVASLGTDLWYDAQPLLAKVARVVRDTPFAPTERPFDWAQCLKHCAKAIMKSDFAGAHGMLTQARDAYARSDQKTAFTVTQHAECFVLLDDGEAAARVLDSLPASERNVHWHHRRAQSYRLVGELSSARNEIDLGLVTAEEKFKSAFLRERFLVRKAAVDAAAADDLREAIACCSNARYRAELAAELQSELGGSGPNVSWLQFFAVSKDVGNDS